MKKFLVILTLALVSAFAAPSALGQQIRAPNGTTDKPGVGFIDAPNAQLGADGGYFGGWGLKRVKPSGAVSDSMCVTGDNLTIGCFSKANGYSGRVDAGVNVKVVSCPAIVWGATDAGRHDSVLCDAGIGALTGYVGTSCSVGLPVVALEATGSSVWWCAAHNVNQLAVFRLCSQRMGTVGADCGAVASSTYQATFFAAP